MSIYTKTGDKGSTSLLNGTRVPKNHIRVEAYGSIDELNAHIALIETIANDEEIKKELFVIQKNLFVIQTHLAIDTDVPCQFEFPDIQKLSSQALETAIDTMTAQIPKSRSFYMLGGHPTIAQCHIARCICRRTERVLVDMSQKHLVHSLIFCYINRLSDYLFVLARYFAKILEVEEKTVQW